MKLIADENLARDIVDWLRSVGCDVTYACDSEPGATDAHWIDRANRESRLVLTSDKDFGELIFRDRLSSHGVVLLRLADLNVADALTRLKAAWSVVEANPTGCFIVITEKKVRVRPLKTVGPDQAS